MVPVLSRLFRKDTTSPAPIVLSSFKRAPVSTCREMPVPTPLARINDPPCAAIVLLLPVPAAVIVPSTPPKPAMEPLEDPLPSTIPPRSSKLPPASSTAPAAIVSVCPMVKAPVLIMRRVWLALPIAIAAAILSVLPICRVLGAALAIARVTPLPIEPSRLRVPPDAVTMLPLALPPVRIGARIVPAPRIVPAVALSPRKIPAASVRLPPSNSIVPAITVCAISINTVAVAPISSFWLALVMTATVDPLLKP